MFAGDTVKCEARIVEFEPGEEYISVRTDFVCRNQHGKEVMTGHAQGIVRPEGKEQRAKSNESRAKKTPT